MKKTLVLALSFVFLFSFPALGKVSSKQETKPGPNVKLEVTICRPVNTESATRELNSALGNKVNSSAGLAPSSGNLFQKGRDSVIACSETQSEAVLSLLKKLGIQSQSNDLTPVGLTTKIQASNEVEGYSLEVTPTVDFERSPEGLVNLKFSHDLWSRVDLTASGEPVMDHSGFGTSILLSKNGSVLCIQDGLVIFYQAKVVR
jgi:hypothetical protein